MGAASVRKSQEWGAQAHSPRGAASTCRAGWLPWSQWHRRAALVSGLLPVAPATARTSPGLWRACPGLSTRCHRSTDAPVTEAAPTLATASEMPPDCEWSSRSAKQGGHGHWTALSPPRAGELSSSSRSQRPRGLHGGPAPPPPAPRRPEDSTWLPREVAADPTARGVCRRPCSRSGAGWGWHSGGGGGPGTLSPTGMTHARGRGWGVARHGALPARAAGTWACPAWPPPRASGSSLTSWTAAPELGPDSKRTGGSGLEPGRVWAARTGGSRLSLVLWACLCLCTTPWVPGHAGCTRHSRVTGGALEGVVVQRPPGASLVLTSRPGGRLCPTC